MLSIAISHKIWGESKFIDVYTMSINLVTLLAFLPQACNQETLRGQMCKIKGTTNLTRNPDL